MNFLERLRNLPKGQRKVIFWTLTVILSVIVIVFFSWLTKRRLEKINFQLPLPPLKEEKTFQTIDEILKKFNAK